jgi:hypothetical protein|tara:strand:- start:1071 stop:1376 length:306 start_codon:yes stop_codon:yes gene_type:complete
MLSTLKAWSPPKSESLVSSEVILTAPLGTARNKASNSALLRYGAALAQSLRISVCPVLDKEIGLIPMESLNVGVVPKSTLKAPIHVLSKKSILALRAASRA